MKCKLLISLFLFSLLIVTGCKSSKQEVVSAEKSYVKGSTRYDAVVSGYADWSTFSSRGKIGIGSGKITTTSMEMRMVRGKYIQISIRPVLGIEMGKLYINNDSIFIQDKFNKIFVADNLSNFTMGFPFDITTMQDLFLGRAFDIKEGTLTKKDVKKVDITEDVNGDWKITPKETIYGYVYSFLFNSSNNMKALEVKEEKQALPYKVTYGDYVISGIYKCPMNVAISANIDNRPFSLNVNFDETRIKWDQSFNDKLEMGGGYRKATLNEYISIIKNM